MTGLPRLSYVPCVSHAREQATRELAHMHWLTYTEDPAGVPGKYEDGVLAEITRSPRKPDIVRWYQEDQVTRCTCVADHTRRGKCSNPG